MNDIPEKLQIIQKNRNKNKNIFIAIWVLLALASLIWAVSILSRDMSYPAQMRELYDEQINDNDIYAAINDYDEVNYIVSNDSDYKKHYYIFKKYDYSFIVFMNEKDANQVFNAEEAIVITGSTTKISDDLRKAIIEYGKDQTVNEENFYDTFGYIYLNATRQPNDATSQFVMIVLCLVIVSFLIFSKNKLSKATENNFSKLTSKEVNLLEKELNNPLYETKKLILTDTFIICYYTHLEVLKYSDIIWAYGTNYKTNTITTTKQVTVVTNDGLVHNIEGFDPLGKKNKQSFNDIFELITLKNKKVIVGYDDSTLAEVKLKYGHLFEKKK